MNTKLKSTKGVLFILLVMEFSMLIGFACGRIMTQKTEVKCVTVMAIQTHTEEAKENADTIKISF